MTAPQTLAQANVAAQSQHMPALKSHGTAADRVDLSEIFSGTGDLAQSVVELRALLRDARREIGQLGKRLTDVRSLGSEAARRVEMASLAPTVEAALGRVKHIQSALAAAQEALEKNQSSALASARKHAAQQALVALMEDGAVLEEHLHMLESRLDVGEGSQNSRQWRKRQAMRESGHNALPLDTDTQEPAGSAGFVPKGALRDKLEALSGQVGQVLADGSHDGQGATSGAAAELQTEWGKLVRDEAYKVAHADPNEMAQWVMRKAYEDNTQDMRRYAVRVQFHNELRSQVRSEAQRARQFLSELQGGGVTKGSFDPPFDAQKFFKDPAVDEDGVWRLRPTSKDKDIATVEGLNSYVTDLEQLGTSVGDDMQVTQLELQATMQRQQQMMNALSNVSKALHETSMAILRKIGS